jgi:hypothetical protein
MFHFYITFVLLVHLFKLVRGIFFLICVQARYTYILRKKSVKKACIMEAECVYCAVRNASLSKVQINFTPANVNWTEYLEMS